MPEIQRQRVRYLDTPALADLLNVSTDAVKRMRANGRGPRFIRVNGNVRYAPWDVKAWHDDHAEGGDHATR